jgi:hypothetical protein
VKVVIRCAAEDQARRQRPNHPFGDRAVSNPDIRLTRQLVYAARVLDVAIHNGVIIGNGTFAWVHAAARGCFGEYDDLLHSANNQKRQSVDSALSG